MNLHCLFLGHKFAPRYDASAQMVATNGSTVNIGELHLAPITYVGDICERCGKELQRNLVDKSYGVAGSK